MDPLSSCYECDMPLVTVLLYLIYGKVTRKGLQKVTRKGLEAITLQNEAFIVEQFVLLGTYILSIACI